MTFSGAASKSGTPALPRMVATMKRTTNATAPSALHRSKPERVEGLFGVVMGQRVRWPPITVKHRHGQPSGIHTLLDARASQTCHGSIAPLGPRRTAS